MVCLSSAWLKNRPHLLPSIHLAWNPKRVIVQWVGIGTHTHTHTIIMIIELTKLVRQWVVYISEMPDSQSDKSHEQHFWVLFATLLDSDVSVTSPMSQLILQPFCRFTYITAHYPTLPLLHLRHSSFPTLLSLLIRHRLFTFHLVSHPWFNLCGEFQ